MVDASDTNLHTKKPHMVRSHLRKDIFRKFPQFEIRILYRFGDIVETFELVWGIEVTESELER